MWGHRLRRKSRAAWQVMQAHLSGKRVPIMANLLVTNQCNLDCFYCYVDVKGRTVQEVPFEQLLGIVDDLFDLGTRVFVLLGGEPLLRKDIGGIVEHIQKRGAFCELITNGYLVAKTIDAIKGVDSICVSLDGPREVNDLNRGKGAFDAAVQAIDILLDYGVPTRIKGVITRNNVDALDWLERFARERGIMVTMSTAAIYSERSYRQEDRWLTNEEDRVFCHTLLRLRSRGTSVGYSPKALRYALQWPYARDHIINGRCDNNPENYPLIRCLRKDRSLYIDVDGGMYPCAYQWGKGQLNALDLGVREAWRRFEFFDCYACASVPDVEMTLLLRLDPADMLRAVRL